MHSHNEETYTVRLSQEYCWDWVFLLMILVRRIDHMLITLPGSWRMHGVCNYNEEKDQDFFTNSTSDVKNRILSHKYKYKSILFFSKKKRKNPNKQNKFRIGTRWTGSSKNASAFTVHQSINASPPCQVVAKNKVLSEKPTVWEVNTEYIPEKTWGKCFALLLHYNFSKWKTLSIWGHHTSRKTQRVSLPLTTEQQYHHHSSKKHKTEKKLKKMKSD